MRPSSEKYKVSRGPVVASTRPFAFAILLQLQYNEASPALRYLVADDVVHMPLPTPSPLGL